MVKSPCFRLAAREVQLDNIGNRTSTKAGGDAYGVGLRSATYGANNLNQITNRSVPGAVDILGIAKATASVTVNSVAVTSRKSEYYHKEVSVANSSAAVWQSVSVVATEGANNTTVNGNVFVPQTPESFLFDLDGNQTSDGRWTYTWDGENRLTKIEALSGIPDAAKKKVECEYDWQNRRIRKKVYSWISGAWALDSEFKFLYDRWNLIAITDGSNTLLYSFVWGSDLSGSLQDAGGVGGLISIKVHTGPNAGTYFYAYDGNGNVAALINAANGAIAATYKYSPFGELIRATGPLAFINPFRFSTKFHDYETDLIYYGYRYYSPSTGRWLNRDPIEEKGGINLYCFVGNVPLARYDRLGRDWFDVCTDYFYVWGEAGQMFWSWVKGSGDDMRKFGPNDRFTRLMQGDGCVQEAIEFWRKKNGGKGCCDRLLPVTNYRCAFGLSELIGAGINPAQQFVGSYRVDITPNYNESSVTIKLSNNTSLTSFLYGIAPDWERSSFRPCGNMRQIYEWGQPCSDFLNQ